MIRLFRGRTSSPAQASRAAEPAAAPRRYQAATGRDMDNFFAQVRAGFRPFANPVAAYEALIDGLLAAPGVDILPLFEFARSAPSDRRVVGLRHDVDADIQTAVVLARLLARRGVCGSFYLLHTSPYYGDLHEGVFVRCPLLAGWVRDLVVAGCEIGLHNDALGLHLRGPYDAAAALRTEIDWLRAHGAAVRGTTAHNSAPSHGAENYEVFKGRLLWDRVVTGPDGGPLPLGTIDEAALGLEYEGTCARPRARFDRAAAEAFCAARAEADIRSEAWMRRYLLDNPCCEWTTDMQAWVIGRDRWVVAGRVPGAGPVFRWNIGVREVVAEIAALPLETRTMLVLHPGYFNAAPEDDRGADR